MSFKDDYLKYNQPSLEREEFVLKSLTSLSKDIVVKSLKPITVPGVENTKITYEVMPDYISIDGMRVPMSGSTAQKIANHFNMSLPNAKISKEIHENAEIKVAANPLSGTGTNVDGKQYSGSEVVNKGVGYAPFAVNYNNNINKQLNQKGYTGNEIVSGFAKDILAPINGKLGLHGFYDANGKAIQGGNGQTPHETQTHTEYGSYVRLISPQATITYPNGTKEIRELDQVYHIDKYNSKSTPGISQPIYSPEKPKSGRLQLIERIDDILSKVKV